MKILVIEDELKIAQFLKAVLEEEKNIVTICDNVELALKNKYQLDHDLIILDIMLSGTNGDHMVIELRKSGSKIPILILSALNQIGKKIELINLGADDYMVKPFDAQELIARINALHRRHIELKQNTDEETYKDITFTWRQNKITREGKEIQLTKKETELLRYLLKNKNQAVSIEDILAGVWHSKIGYQSNVVQATIRRLRKKIDEDFEHHLITNVHGIGYKITLEE